MNDREMVIEILEKTFRTKWTDWETSKGQFADAILAAGFHRPSAVPVVPKPAEIHAALCNAWDAVPGQDDFADPETIGIQTQAVVSLLTRSGWLDLSTVERWGEYDFGLQKTLSGEWVRFSNLQPKEKP